LVPGETYEIEITPDDPAYAEYDAGLGAPKCADATSPCWANTTLFGCADTLEPNFPNTIDVCTDYGGMSCLSDESIENISIGSTTDTTFNPGESVQVNVTFYAYGASDDIYIFYTNSTSSISWQNKGFMNAAGAGYGTHSVTFSLDDVAGQHAIRAKIQDGAGSNPCSATSYYDHDDLAFQVQSDSTPVYGCMPIESGGTYVLDGDISGANQSAQSCLLINASGVTLDCDGNSIENDGTSGTTYGVLVNGTAENVKIINCLLVNGYTYGTALHNASGSNIDPSYFCNNSIGILVNESNHTIIDDSIACNNALYGIQVVNSHNVSINRSRMFNNSMDLRLNNSVLSSMAVNLTNVVFDNFLWGNFTNFTNISMNDSLATSSAYFINWSQAPAALPGTNISFGGKFINISILDGAVSIDSILWHWNSSEASGYKESMLKLQKYGSGAWSMQNATPDTTNRVLSLYSMNPASVYGILEDNVTLDCVDLLDDTTWNDSINNVSGVLFVNNTLTLCPGTYYTNYTMFSVNGSGFVIDCQGAALIGDNDSGNHGVDFNGSDYVGVNDCVFKYFDRAVNLNRVGFPANYNNVTNCEIYRGAPFSSAGIYLYPGDNNNFSNNTMHDTYYSFYIYDGEHNTVRNNTLLRVQYGVYLRDVGFAANYNYLYDNNVTNGTYIGIYNYGSPTTGVRTVMRNNYLHGGSYGIYDYGGQYTIADDNTIANASSRGVYLYRYNDYAIYRNTTIYGSSYGIQAYGATNATFVNTHLYNNSYQDLRAQGYTGGVENFFHYLTIDRPQGDMQDYTTLYIRDTLPSSGDYFHIIWTSNVSQIPENNISFRNKWVNITGGGTSPTISFINWTWLDSEVTGLYNESEFRLYQFSGGPWVKMNNTPNVTLNTLGLTNLDPSSQYAILQDYAVDFSVLYGCADISSSGFYKLANAVQGANITTVPGDYACIKISTSNVKFDCLQNSITDDGTAGISSGIFVDGALSNVTIQNCTEVSDYDHGLYIHESNYTALDSSFKSYFCNNSASGVTVNASNNTLILDAVMCNSSGKGLSVIDSYNTTVRHPKMFNNSYDMLVNNTLASAVDLNITHAVFDNPTHGNLSNYTNLSLNDSVAASSSYFINWSAQPAALVGTNETFNDKYVNISIMQGAVSIDRIFWFWKDADVG
ncbi:TPA: hypothetical protein EYP38_00600, partial [Candidatus Micrarchaeota archaeon]|nr:hypothetical protein [Candidatus Micrarchaeota archaeon]